MIYSKVEANFKVNRKMKIGELAARSGVATSAIRYYEQAGLLPKAQRGANGYRVYSEATLNQLELVRLGQNLGFALDAIRAVVGLEGTTFQNALMEKVEARLHEIDRMMQTLTAQRESLMATKRELQTSAGACLAHTNQARKPRQSGSRS